VRFGASLSAGMVKMLPRTLSIGKKTLQLRRF
jgi:hypothetical protein